MIFFYFYLHCRNHIFRRWSHDAWTGIYIYARQLQIKCLDYIQMGREMCTGTLLALNSFHPFDVTPTQNKERKKIRWWKWKSVRSVFVFTVDFVYKSKKIIKKRNFCLIVKLFCLFVHFSSFSHEFYLIYTYNATCAYIIFHLKIIFFFAYYEKYVY